MPCLYHGYSALVTDAPLRVAGYLARTHGLAGLRALLDAPGYELACVLTHRRLPRSEDPARPDRPEFVAYRDLAAAHGFPLHAVDGKRDRARIADWLSACNVDLIGCISWRYLITPAELSVPRRGGVNLHRGELPFFAGAAPIEQALRAKRPHVVVTAHTLTDEIDAGPVLATATHPVGDRATESLEESVARLKQEITPLFGRLLILALDLQAAGGRPQD